MFPVSSEQKYPGYRADLGVLTSYRPTLDTVPLSARDPGGIALSSVPPGPVQPKPQDERPLALQCVLPGSTERY